MARKLTKAELESGGQFTPMSGKKRSKKEAFHDFFVESKGFVWVVLAIAVSAAFIILMQKNEKIDMRVAFVTSDGAITETMQTRIEKFFSYYSPDLDKDTKKYVKVSAAYFNESEKEMSEREKKANETFLKLLEKNNTAVLVADEVSARYLCDNGYLLDLSQISDRFTGTQNALLVGETELFYDKSAMGVGVLSDDEGYYEAFKEYYIVFLNTTDDENAIKAMEYFLESILTKWSGTDAEAFVPAGQSPM